MSAIFVAMASTPLAALAAPPVDFVRDVQPMIERCCVRCHTAQGPAPYDFTSAAGVKRISKTARAALDSRTMPPWPATNGVMVRPPMPTDEERALFARWVTEGASIPAKATPLRVPPEPGPSVAQWSIGSDWTLTPIERSAMRSFQVASGVDAPLAIGGWRARWATPAIVSIVFLNSGDAIMALQLDERDGATGFKLTGDLGDRPSGSIGAVGIDGLLELPAGTAVAIGPTEALVAECHADGLGKVVPTGFTLEALAPKALDGQPLRMLEPLLIDARVSSSVRTEGTKTTMVRRPLERSVDLACIMLRPGTYATRAVLSATAEGGVAQVLVEVPIYDLHTNRPFVVDPMVTLAAGSTLTLTVDACNDTQARKSQPQAVLLVAAATAAAPSLAVEPPSFHGDEIAVRAWLASVERTTVDGKAWLATQIVPAALAESILGTTLPPRTGESTAAGMSWFEAIDLANRVSLASACTPRYELSAAKRVDGRLVGAVVRELDTDGWRLPTEAVWSNTLGPARPPGEVWNWCEDAVGEQRVMRGGCWADRAAARGVKARSVVEPSSRNELFGVRLVRPTPTQAIAPQ